MGEEVGLRNGPWGVGLGAWDVRLDRFISQSTTYTNVLLCEWESDDETQLPSIIHLPRYATAWGRKENHYRQSCPTPHSIMVGSLHSSGTQLLILLLSQITTKVPEIENEELDITILLINITTTFHAFFSKYFLINLKNLKRSGKSLK